MYTPGPDEVKKYEEELTELYDSVDLEDKICAILRDMNIGRTGINNPLARTKAIAIMELIEKNPQTQYIKDGKIVFNVNWILSRIQFLTTLNKPDRLPTHKNIWQVSYDIQNSEQDRIDATEIPKFRMKHLKDLGLIDNKIVKKDKYDVEIWQLTELGLEFLKNAKSQSN